MPPCVVFPYGPVENAVNPDTCILEKFYVYETRSRFYIVGRDKSKQHWRVLKIDRSEPTELCLCEDSVVYTKREQFALLFTIADGNKSTGGLTKVTKAYGIVGFIKFLDCYYLIVVTKRRQVGTLCGHAIYTVVESLLIAVPHRSVQTDVATSPDESRYKRLLQGVDLTKDFYFSYTYRIMQSVQRNEILRNDTSMQYENMFVWNAFLSRGIREEVKSTRWTVALMHGFFEQSNFSTFGRLFSIFLISRRSRHFAGPRYLKRGVNDKGRVANDVETEQIVVNETGSGPGYERISSVVQVRGSIPLFWSQEASRLNAKPDIHVRRIDPMYNATNLHFKDLENRYGNPITVLNLIKTQEKRPREMILRREFAQAVKYLNSIRSAETSLNFIHWDYHKYSKSKMTNVIAVLGKIASDTLDLTDMYYSGVPRLSKSAQHQHSAQASTDLAPSTTMAASMDRDWKRGQSFQSGVLRTNCIDCIDRTNVAQYSFGLAALGRQLHAVGLSDSPEVHMNGKVEVTLMSMYENMGNVVALQYGGSPAHNKVFPERQGRWKAATQSTEIFNSIRRFYSNTVTDREKQDAMNLFLGYFRPQGGKPALWELETDYYLHVAGYEDDFSMDYKAPVAISGAVIVQAHRKRNEAMPVSCRHPDDYHCWKLTSFDKLLQVKCASEQSMQPRGSELPETMSFPAPLSTPDAVEVLLTSPNWLFGSKNQDHPASVVPSVVPDTAPVESEDELEKELVGMDWMSLYSPSAEEEELYDRYILQASSDYDIWYGTRLLPGTVEHSEANLHYQQYCTGPTLESLISDNREEGDYNSVTGATDVSDEEMVTRSMEAALSQFHIGVEDCSVRPETSEALDFTPALKRWTPEAGVICRIVKH